jgi:hypothetical protein
VHRIRFDTEYLRDPEAVALGDGAEITVPDVRHAALTERAAAAVGSL